VRAVIDGRELKVGGPALLRELEMDPPAELRDAADRFGQSGRAAVYLTDDSGVLAVFAIADAIRPESLEAVKRLQQKGITVAMLTGDCARGGGQHCKRAGHRHRFCRGAAARQG
jgi:P-type Cu2+ transporter